MTLCIGNELDCRILLVDDGLANQQIIAYVLRKAGAEVSVAENGQVAVDLALAARQADSAFDIILMDIQMPVMDGYEATRQLRKAGYTRPIIALTANATTGSRQKCLDAGCDDYMTRPSDVSTLVAAVANAVSTTKQPLPKVLIGSKVRVKTGVTVPNRPDMPMGGWHGKVYQVSGNICLVHWSNATLEALRSIHRERRQRDGVDFEFMWLQEGVLEFDRGEPLCIEQPKEETR